MKTRLQLVISIIILSAGVLGCNFYGSYSQSVNKTSGSSANWTGDKITGLELIKGQKVNFSYFSEVKSGELSMQLFNPAKEVIQQFEPDKKGNLELVIEVSGKYTIVIKGNKFNGSYQVKW